MHQVCLDKIQKLRIKLINIPKFSHNYNNYKLKENSISV
jgi:hypothetical protein